MMSKSQHRQPKLFYQGFSLERRVPQGHPLRNVKQLVDFSFIRSQVEHHYGPNGNVSVDPTIILKLMFLLFYENVKSERALMEQLPVRLDWLWFCEYDLDDAIPDHSVLSKARRRWGQEAFETFFMNILEQCIQAGLVDGQTIHIDSSTIDGNADIGKVRPQLRTISRELSQRLEEEETLPSETPQKTAVERLNPSDPDARIGSKNGQSTLGYKDHRVVDDKEGIITATITTPANVRDDKVLPEAVASHQFRTKIKAKTAVADKIYGTGANYKLLYGMGMTCSIPHPAPHTPHADKFKIDRFTYDAAQDCYLCPASQKLHPYNQRRMAGTRYRCDRQICERCEYFTHCVSSEKHGRQVERNSNADYVQWADHCLPRHERRRLMSRRQYKAEGSFADGANQHGFKRARWRGLEKMTIQNLMIAAIQNLRKLMRSLYRSTKTPAAALKIDLVARYTEIMAPITSRIYSVVSEYVLFKEPTAIQEPCR